MKKACVVFCMVLCVISSKMADATIRFETTQAFQFFNDARWDGSNRHFGIIYDIGDNVQAGFFFEEGLWDWRADVGQPVPNFVNVNATVHGLTMLKQLTKYLAAGIDVGTAQITVNSAGGTTATVGAAAPLSQTKPFVDILGRVNYSVTKEKITSGVYFDLGYRFMDINDMATGGVLGAAAERTLTDLNALILGIGVHIGF